MEEKFKLYTRDGGFVAEVTLPVFTPKVEIVRWGARHFIWSNSTQRYVEGLVFCVLPLREEIVTVSPPY